jgi:hypothetical protein
MNRLRALGRRVFEGPSPTPFELVTMAVLIALGIIVAIRV